MFAGLLTKVGVYAIIRTQTLLFPGGALDDLLMWAALATMVIGILGAVAQTDLRRLLSFTLVSHIGYMVFGIALGTAAGLAGAIFYVAHHIAIQTTLFLVAGLIERQGGTTSIDRLGGLARRSPLLAVLFFVPAMNLAGIPPLSGFIGKLGLLRGRRGRRQRRWRTCWSPAGVVTSLLTLVAIARVWTRAFWRPPTQAPGRGHRRGRRGRRRRLGRRRRRPRWTAAGPDGDDGELTARQVAWRRHTRVATAADPDVAPAAGAVRALRPLPRGDGRGHRGAGGGHRGADRDRRASSTGWPTGPPTTSWSGRRTSSRCSTPRPRRSAE